MQILRTPNANVASWMNHPTWLGLNLVGQTSEPYQTAFAKPEKLLRWGCPTLVGKRTQVRTKLSLRLANALRSRPLTTNCPDAHGQSRAGGVHCRLGDSTPGAGHTTRQPGPVGLKSLVWESAVGLAHTRLGSDSAAHFSHF